MKTMMNCSSASYDTMLIWVIFELQLVVAKMILLLLLLLLLLFIINLITMCFLFCLFQN